MQLLGPNTMITSSSRVSAEGLGVTNIKPGEVVQI